MLRENLQQEWLLHQAQYDAYERMSLIIKLFAIAALIAMLALMIDFLLSLVTLSVIWLLDGIWKTYQSRIEQRLLVLEAALGTDAESPSTAQAFQFNREFERLRPSGTGLFVEYLKQACRPTVAVVYAVLILVLLIS
ncbi:hypothetical protein [Reinekea sp. G2M2-21]|uniref:hypothetical protein n=1 Tax=Reinekea sp. G2M2-21 TaxID=2788942 RepID=UPI0018A9C190|nr:hypothetical protein [Reinekea sp. G2M2-21]